VRWQVLLLQFTGTSIVRKSHIWNTKYDVQAKEIRGFRLHFEVFWAKIPAIRHWRSGCWHTKCLSAAQDGLHRADALRAFAL